MIIETTRERLLITVDNPTEAIRVADIFLKIQPTDERFLAYASGEIQEIVLPAPKKHYDMGGGWFEGWCSSDYGVPYWQELQRRTGITECDLIPLPSIEGFYHTNISPMMHFDPSDQLVKGSMIVIVYLNGPVTPHEYVRQGNRRIQRLLDEDLGQPHVELEYIQLNNGLYRKNPNWGTGRYVAPQKVAYNEKVWRDFWMYWEKNHATPGQRNVLAQRYRTGKYDTHPSLVCRHIGVDNYNRVIEWDEFQTL